MFKYLLYNIYEKYLLSQVDKSKIPSHLGVILDGNRRWAQNNNKDIAYGHKAGAKAAINFIDWCRSLKIKTISLYLLSLDNIKKRGKDEIQNIIDSVIFIINNLKNKNYKLIHAGSKGALPKRLSEILESAEKNTQNCDGGEIILAIGYSGRSDIVSAIKSLAKEEERLGKSLNEFANNLTPYQISQKLSTQNIKDPEIIIRTSGQYRISDFLLWQSAYSEFYFIDSFWPSIRRIDLLRALRNFTNKKRNMGG